VTGIVLINMRKVVVMIALVSMMLTGCGSRLPAARQAVISFTFDDAPYQDWDVIKPILDGAGIKAGFAVPSSFPDGQKTLSWVQVKELQDDGNEIIAYTMDRSHLGPLPRSAQVDQIDNRSVYERHGVHVRGFAYPFGEFDDQQIPIVKHYYDYALATDRPGTPATAVPLDVYKIRRTSVTGRSSTRDLFNAIDAAVAHNDLLVFVVNSAEWPFMDGGAKKLSDTIAHAQAKKVRIATPSAAIAMSQ